MVKDIAIFAAGGFGREVAMLIEQINKVSQVYNIVGFFDDGVEKGTMVNGYPVLGGVDVLNNFPEPLNIVFAIGDPKIKSKLKCAISNSRIQYPKLIHPNVEMGRFITIGDGTIITAGCVLTENIVIGEHVVLNLCCTVGHDAVIENYSSFMPNVNISGETIIEENVYVGTAATIINQKIIGAGSIIGAGAVIVKDVPKGSTVVGNPGRIIKTNSNL